MIIKRIITNINCIAIEAARHLWLIYYRHDNSWLSTPDISLPLVSEDKLFWNFRRFER